MIVEECKNITYKIVRLGSDFIQLLQMLLPPPSCEELFPPRNVQGENKTYEEIRSRSKEVNFLTCEKSDKINNKIVLPLREDPCRSFFSRVTTWGDEVKLRERKKAVFTRKTSKIIVDLLFRSATIMENWITRDGGLGLGGWRTGRGFTG